MDLVLDFSGKSGKEFLMYNYAPDSPFGGDFDSDLKRPTARIVKFVVSKPLNNKIADASVKVGTALSAMPMPGLPTDYVTAQQHLVLFEGSDQYGRLMPMLGTVDGGSQSFDDMISENPALNETQVWEVFNATADAHPIHLHLVMFQVLGRGGFHGEATPRDQVMHDGSIAEGGGRDFTLFGITSWRRPESNELGWKDTHIVYPGEYSQVRAAFDRPGLYVWHCHILSHEDHEMMRHFYVGPMPATMMMQNTGVADVQNAPNPFAMDTKFLFEIQNAQSVQLAVRDQFGTLRYQHRANFAAGKHALLWDGRDSYGDQLPNGIYTYQLVGENFQATERLLISR
jgi:spore coat protein A